MATVTPTTRRTVLASMSCRCTHSHRPGTGRRGVLHRRTDHAWPALSEVHGADTLDWRHEIDDDDVATHARLDRYHAELDRTRAEIVARPATSVGDLVDRLILATHECDPGWDVRRDKVIPALAGALQAAGITPGECCVGEWQKADALAA